MKKLLVACLLGLSAVGASAREFRFDDVISSITIPDGWHVLQKKDYDRTLDRGLNALTQENEARLKDIIRKTEDDIVVLLAASKNSPQEPKDNAYVQVMRSRIQPGDKFDPENIIAFMQKSFSVPGGKVDAETPSSVVLKGKTLHFLRFRLSSATITRWIDSYFFYGDGFLFNAQTSYTAQEDEKTLKKILDSLVPAF